VTVWPLAVDLDGTLIDSDVLALGIAKLVRDRPLAFIGAVFKLLGGRPPFKRAVASLAALDMAALPWRADVLAWLAAEKAKGRTLVLATAADRATAQRVGDHLGLFSEVYASGGAINLKAGAKARALATRFPDGFAYAGDSAADLAVWRTAKAIILVHVKPAIAARALALGKPVERTFGPPS
jgi:phosphoserine phosphatase